MIHETPRNNCLALNQTTSFAFDLSRDHYCDDAGYNRVLLYRTLAAIALKSSD
jgi:hypothetical protein